MPFRATLVRYRERRRRAVKIIVLIAAVCAVVGYVVLYSGLLEDKVQCPACQGTGKLLPDEESCGSHKERSRLPEESEEREECFSSEPCPYCKGEGRVRKSKAPEIPASQYTMDDLQGHSAGVLAESPP